MSSNRYDLGGGFSYRYFRYHDIEQAGVTVWFKNRAVGACWFDFPHVRASLPLSEGADDRRFWTVVDQNPLHLEPSIQTYSYVPATNGQPARFEPEFHGYIRGGVWVPA